MQLKSMQINSATRLNHDQSYLTDSRQFFYRLTHHKSEGLLGADVAEGVSYQYRYN